MDKENPGERREGGKEVIAVMVYSAEKGGGRRGQIYEMGMGWGFLGGGWYYLQNW